ncbi:MAG: hypothetical protein PVG99_06275 [Desulfobacteraceae bacterium]|jgi:hypothetical protein
MNRFSVQTWAFVFAAFLGCAGPFTQARFQVDESFRTPDFSLRGKRVGFVTPSSAHELEDQWILLDLLAKTLKENRKETIVTLPSECLSLISQAGLAKAYNKAIKDFQTSGSLDKGFLMKLGEILDVQYVVYLSLNSFNQYASTRLSAFGLRAIDSQTAMLRLFLRILETDQARIVWEGSGEGIIVREEFRARPVTFNELGQLACEGVVENLP